MFTACDSIISNSHCTIKGKGFNILFYAAGVVPESGLLELGSSVLKARIKRVELYEVEMEGYDMTFTLREGGVRPMRLSTNI